MSQLQLSRALNNAGMAEAQNRKQSTRVAESASE
jgi:hypothetical protein